MADNSYGSGTNGGAYGFGMHDLVVDLFNALSTVKELSEVSYQADDEKQLIRRALASLIQNQDMERCSFFAVDGDGWLTNVVGLSFVELNLPEVPAGDTTRFKVGDGVIGLAASTGQLQYCQNCLEDERFSSESDSAAVPGSLISVPVFTCDEQLIGVLNVSHPLPYFFTDWHMRLLEIYKNMLGQLITTRRLLRQMDQQIALRTSQLESLVAETKQLKDHFASMSMLDQLTGLHNRRYFYDQVEIAISHHKRYRNSFCLLVMDIDFFKRINDRHGHLFGDEVLVGVSEALKKLVRASDILVRFGGEEFVLVFTNTCCEGGYALAERIRQEIKTLRWHVGLETVNVTLSVGLHCVDSGYHDTHEAIDIDDIIHCADLALYQAKTSGRDRIVVYSNGLTKDG
ncbi:MULTISPECIES: sensor domain-containing diguanylate cyclase [Methylomonas]|uniref:diguanylate cyclase n=1 Tax=Methylomonas koyamae TaxID=702114 RepID=A0A177NLC1_9GAMM|nr:sensor domain-containing diguanylate cyclase [Methylomonas koyamae]OAI17989.1 diguanylate cyclase [Methylomonas koyamae]